MEMKKVGCENRRSVNAFILRQWFSMDMVVHGECIHLGAADGWAACEEDEIIGLITYRIVRNEMEILSLDSLAENRGIGTALLEKAVGEAREKGCARIMLMTTNDNLHALGFYQRRGFDMVRLYRNAVDAVRRIKPQIPLTGAGGIPIRHEIELEMIL